MVNRIKNFFKMVFDIVKECVSEIIYFIKFIFPYVIKLIKFILPFITYYIGYVGYKQFNNIIYILLVVDFILFFCDGVKKRVTPSGIPVPTTRFTEINGEEINVQNSRLQEMILYMAELEEYFSRKGKL